MACESVKRASKKLDYRDTSPRNDQGLVNFCMRRCCTVQHFLPNLSFSLPLSNPRLLHLWARTRSRGVITSPIAAAVSIAGEMASGCPQSYRRPSAHAALLRSTRRRQRFTCLMFTCATRLVYMQVFLPRHAVIAEKRRWARLASLYMFRGKAFLSRLSRVVALRLDHVVRLTCKRAEVIYSNA